MRASISPVALEARLRADARRPFTVITAACGVAGLAYVHRVGFGSLGPRIKTELSLSDQDYSYVMTSFLLAYGFFEIPWGVLCDRAGARRVLLLTLVGSSLLTAATALVAGEAFRALGILILIRTLFGTFQAGIFPALTRLVADGVPLERRATAKGFIWSASRAGGAAASLLVTALVVRVDWPWTLAILGGLGAVWAGSCTWFLPGSKPRPAEVALPRAARAVPWKELFLSTNVWALCLLYGFGGFMASFYVTTLHDYLKTHRGFDEGTVAWMAALPLGCGIVACFSGGLLSDYLIRRTGQRKWCRRLQGAAGYTIAGSAALATIWVDEAVPLAVLLAVSFVGFDLTMATAWASCVDIGGRWAGTLGGAMNMVGNILSAGGTFVAGQLLGHTFGAWDGSRLLFVCFAISYGLGALLWLRVNVDERPLSDS